MVLQRCVMMGETLKLSPTVWEKCLKKDVMEMIQFLLKKKGSRDYPKAETTLRQALKIMTKMFLQFLDIFKEAPDFPETWTKVLQLLQVTHPTLTLNEIFDIAIVYRTRR